MTLLRRLNNLSCNKTRSYIQQVYSRKRALCKYPRTRPGLNTSLEMSYNMSFNLTTVFVDLLIIVNVLLMTISLVHHDHHHHHRIAVHWITFSL